jgi:hypothetical protein
MKKIALAVLLSLTWMPPGFCQTVDDTLKFTIKTDKKVYEPGEQINVVYELQNVGSPAIPFHEIALGGTVTFGAESEGIRTAVKRSTEWPPAVVLLPSNGQDVISVGGKTTVTFSYSTDVNSLLDLKNNRSDTPEGDYRIKGRLNVYTGPMERLQQMFAQMTSNTVEVSVVKKRR